MPVASVGDSPSGKAVGSGPTIRGFESLIPSQFLAELHKKRDSVINERIPHPQPLELKDAISAFFRARSSIRRASREENTNLAPFNL